MGDELTGPGMAGAGAGAGADAGAGPGAGAGAGRAGALLPRSFFDRPAREVAPALLGCVLEHQTPDGLVAVALTEVEAYAGAVDPASHAYRGRTRRNAVMFGPPGHSYVYFTYGMHFCVNLVCLPAGTAEAVLLRAGAVVEGIPVARQRRPTSRHAADLARGPALLCQALAIDRAQNGADVCAAGSALRIRAPAGSAPRIRAPAGGRSAASAVPGPGAAGVTAAGVTAAGVAGPGVPGEVLTGPRVGVSAGAEVPWRFWIGGDPTVSVYRPYAPRRRAKTETVTATRGEDGTMQP